MAITAQETAPPCLLSVTALAGDVSGKEVGCSARRAVSLSTFLKASRIVLKVSSSLKPCALWKALHFPSALLVARQHDCPQYPRRFAIYLWVFTRRRSCDIQDFNIIPADPSPDHLNSSLDGLFGGINV